MAKLRLRIFFWLRPRLRAEVRGGDSATAVLGKNARRRGRSAPCSRGTDDIHRCLSAAHAGGYRDPEDNRCCRDARACRPASWLRLLNGMRIRMAWTKPFHGQEVDGDFADVPG